MKKKDIIQLVKDAINEIGADAYGDATLTSQGQSKSRFTKTGRPPGVMDEEMTALGYPKGFIPTADKFHQELVGRDTDREFKRIKDDPRSGMSIFAFPYMEGPPSPSLFGRETRMALEASKARAKAAAQKTVDTFKNDIIDYEIASKSPAGVDAQIIYLYVMFKDSLDEALAIQPERLEKIFNAVNNSRTPDFWKNRFKSMYGIEFPSSLKDIDQKQAISMNKFMNDLRNNIKETKLYTVQSTDGTEKQVAFANDAEAKDAIKHSNIKSVVPMEELDLTNDIGKDDYVDDEGRYAKSQLYKMAKYSVKLHQKLDDMEQLPAWLQAKLTKASDYVSMVYHYLDYEMARRDSNLMEEMDEYKKNMFEEPNEGNAFAVARLKAIKAGEDEFEVGGKKHKVTDVSDDDKKAAEDI